MQHMKDRICRNVTVVRNEKVGTRFMVMTLAGSEMPEFKPGQFVNMEVPGKFLRRPVSVCDFEETGGERLLTLLYEVVGEGTTLMSEWEEGRTVGILAPLGNGFNPDAGSSRPILIGGGIGVAPLYMLAKILKGKGVTPTAVLGFRDAGSAVWLKEFSEICPVYVTTEDGVCPAGVPESQWMKGRVTDLLQGHAVDGDYFHACGPMPMMRAVCEAVEIPGELSLDERMGCGFGACMCCSLETKGGSKRICREGPVFRKDELIWK